MTTLAFKNKELESEISTRDLSPLTTNLILGIAPIPDEDIREINNAQTYLYAANELICTLDNGSPTEDFFADPEIRVSGFWKVSDSASSEFLKYKRFETKATVTLFSPGKIAIKIQDEDKQDIDELYQSRGLPRADFGMLLVVLNFKRRGSSNRKEYAYLLKYTHNPLFSSVSLGGLFGSRFSENTYKSPPYSAETFFVPTAETEFVYNFFEPEESEYEIYAARDYKGFELSNIPKYIKVTWDRPSFDLASFNRENTPIDIGALIEEAVGGGIISMPRSSGEPPPEEEPPVSAGFIRIGGIMFPSTFPDEEMASAMSDGPRTSGDALGVFDIPRPTQAENLGVSDPFATYNPDAIDTSSIALSSDYVGYVLEKSRLMEDGEFEIVDLIAVQGKNTTEYIDWRIAYGETYRYRLRSIFRFVNKKNLSMFKDFDSVITREQTVKYVDSTTIQPFKTFYFDSVYSEPVEAQTTEEQRPDPPDGVRLFASSRKKHIMVTWTQKNQNRDVVGFNVYRKIKNENFVKLNQETLGIRSNYYVDRDLEVDVDYIYAIEAIDFHGNYSTLSTQYQIRIQEILGDSEVCEYRQKFVKPEGLEVGARDEVEDDGVIIFKRAVRLNVNPLFQNTDENNTFVISVTSLDTGIKKEIKVNFRTITIYHVAPYVPAQSQSFVSIFTKVKLDAGLLASFYR